MPYAFDPELVPLMELLPGVDSNDVVATRAGLAELIGPMTSSVDPPAWPSRTARSPAPRGHRPSRSGCYTPTAASPAPEGRRPAYLTIHGGGFTVGTIEMETPRRSRSPGELGAWSSPSSTAWRPSTPFQPPSTTATPCCRGYTSTWPSSEWIRPASVSVGRAPGVASPPPRFCSPATGAGPAVCFQFLGIPELDHRLTTTSMRTFVDTPMWHRPDRGAQLGPLFGSPDDDPGRCPRTPHRRSPRT